MISVARCQRRCTKSSTLRRTLSKPSLAMSAAPRLALLAPITGALYLDQRRDALERYADHVKGLTRARLAVVQ